MSVWLGATVLMAVWLGAAMGGGLLLALLAKRIHPALSVRRLWLFYSVLLGFTVAAVLAIAWW